MRLRRRSPRYLGQDGDRLAAVQHTSPKSGRSMWADRPRSEPAFGRVSLRCLTCVQICHSAHCSARRSPERMLCGTNLTLERRYHFPEHETPGRRRKPRRRPGFTHYMLSETHPTQQSESLTRPRQMHELSAIWFHSRTIASQPRNRCLAWCESAQRMSKIASISPGTS